MTDEESTPVGSNVRRIKLYGCPSEECLFTTRDPKKMSEHVNAVHEGEWNDDDWPDPEEFDDDGR